MWKIETIYTEQEAIEILTTRGIAIEKRTVTGYDGDVPYPYRQWQAWNPFLMAWQPLETVFRQAATRAAEAMQRERLANMNLEEFFKP